MNVPVVPKVNISYKDDTLGLGASLKSKDVEHARTGLDAFHGLLGRLNGKTETELQKDAQKVEDKKLALWAQGRWGGMIFVPGGTLVQGEGFNRNVRNSKSPESGEPIKEKETSEVVTERARKRAEREKRKEEKKRGTDAIDNLADENHSVHSSTGRSGTGKRRSTRGTMREENVPKDVAALNTKKQQKDGEQLGTVSTSLGPTPKYHNRVVQVSLSAMDTLVGAPTLAKMGSAIPRNGRHVLRGRNIEAKKLAFSDAKMLDEVRY